MTHGSELSVAVVVGMRAQKLFCWRYEKPQMSFTPIVFVVLIGVVLWGGANGEDDPYQHAIELLSKHPLIDGYN